MYRATGIFFLHWTTIKNANLHNNAQCTIKILITSNQIQTTGRRLCVLSNTKLYHRNLLL